jgi:hypothetical protein
LVVVLEAYFDESERDDGVFALSGFGFDPRQAKLFSKEWVRDFPPERPFHMTDLCARQGKFLGISEPERDRLIRSAVKTCARRVAIIVSITCNLREWERVAPPEKIGHRHPYPIFCFISMMALGEWVSKRSKSGLVSYVFEAGHEHENEAAEAARSIARDPERTRGARYFGHSFVPKEHCPLIQAAQLRSADLIDPPPDQRSPPGPLPRRIRLPVQQSHPAWGG